MEYTKDKLIGVLLENSTKMNEALVGIKDAIESINDQNVLHCQAIEENTKTSQNLVSATNSTYKLFKWVMIALVMAIIMLAGAEKVLTFIPLFP